MAESKPIPLRSWPFPSRNVELTGIPLCERDHLTPASRCQHWKESPTWVCTECRVRVGSEDLPK